MIVADRKPADAHSEADTGQDRRDLTSVECDGGQDRSNTKARVNRRTRVDHFATASATATMMHPIVPSWINRVAITDRTNGTFQTQIAAVTAWPAIFFSVFIAIFRLANAQVKKSTFTWTPAPVPKGLLLMLFQRQTRLDWNKAEAR